MPDEYGHIAATHPYDERDRFQHDRAEQVRRQERHPDEEWWERDSRKSTMNSQWVAQVSNAIAKLQKLQAVVCGDHRHVRLNIDMITPAWAEQFAAHISNAIRNAADEWAQKLELAVRDEVNRPAE